MLHRDGWIDRVCEGREIAGIGGHDGGAITGAAGCARRPAVTEFVPGYEVNSLFGIGAPRGTPTDIIQKLNWEIRVALADPKVDARVAELGGTVHATSPAEFGKLLAAETEKWAQVIRTAHITPD